MRFPGDTAGIPDENVIVVVSILCPVPTVEAVCDGWTLPLPLPHTATGPWNVFAVAAF